MVELQALLHSIGVTEVGVTAPSREGLQASPKNNERQDNKDWRIVAKEQQLRRLLAPIRNAFRAANHVRCGKHAARSRMQLRMQKRCYVRLLRQRLLLMWLCCRG